MGYDIFIISPDEEDVKQQEALRSEYQSKWSLHEQGQITWDDVSKAYDEMRTSDKTYWRWNIWGMMTARRILHKVGAVYDSEAPFYFPDVHDYGLTMEKIHEITDHNKYPEPEKQEKYEEYLKDCTEYLSKEGIGFGIPLHKLSDNSGWVVTPNECSEALTAMANRTDDDLYKIVRQVVERNRFYQENDPIHPEKPILTLDEECKLWFDDIKRFAKFLEYAKDHGGFEVY